MGLGKYIAVLLFASIIGVGAQANPLERFEPESVVKAVKLRDALVESKWIYSLDGNDEVLSFGKDGRIRLIKSLGRVKWQVIGEREIVISGKKGKMLLTFDPSFTKFKTTHFDGKPSKGSLLNSYK